MVVTGAGIITGYGFGWEPNAEGFRQGKNAFRPVTLFDVEKQRVKIAAEAIIPEGLPANHLPKHRARRMERAGKLVCWAADEALRQAVWIDGDAAVVVGTTSGGMNMGEAFYRQAMSSPNVRKGQPSRVASYLAQRQIMDLCAGWNLSGPVSIIANACAASANAIGHAWEMVRHGRTQKALAGGYDALSHLVFAGFDSLQALSPTVCRPFDKNRDGLALGEGAAFLALETLESALKRRAPILAEIVGYGASTDGHHLTQPHPEGEAAFSAMAQACATAGVSAAEVAYINAHGTGTPMNDGSEALAINRWAGSDVGQLWVSSTKAGIGHLLGAAGAVESVACVMALKEQWLPPMLTTETLDPVVKFNLVQKPTKAKELGRPFDFALTNSFGFGGANASLLFRRCP